MKEAPKTDIEVTWMLIAIIICGLSIFVAGVIKYLEWFKIIN